MSEDLYHEIAALRTETAQLRLKLANATSDALVAAHQRGDDLQARVDAILDDVLDLVFCAQDYGFDHGIVMSTFAKWTGPVTDAQIAAFADGYVTPEQRARGYTDEDRQNAIERVTAWRDKYAKEKT